MPDEGHEHELDDCHYSVFQGDPNAHIHCSPHDLDLWTCMATSGGTCWCVHACAEEHGVWTNSGGQQNYPPKRGEQTPPPPAGDPKLDATTLAGERTKLIQGQMTLHYKVLANAPTDWREKRDWWKAARSITRYHAAHFAKLVALYNLYGSANLPGRDELQQSLKNVLAGKAPDGGTLQVIPGPEVVAPTTVSLGVETVQHQHGGSLCKVDHPGCCPPDFPQHGLFECVQYEAPGGGTGFCCTHAKVGSDERPAREHVEDILFCYVKNNQWLKAQKQTEFNVMERYAWLLKRMVEGLRTIKRDKWYHASNEQAAMWAAAIYVRSPKSDDRP